MGTWLSHEGFVSHAFLGEIFEAAYLFGRTLEACEHFFGWHLAFGVWENGIVGSLIETIDDTR